MVKQKNKRIVLIGLILFITIISFIAIVKLTEKQKDIHYQVTESGIIKFTSQPVRFVDKLLLFFTSPIKQAAFQKTTIYVGDTVTMYDTIQPSYDGFKTKKVIFRIYKNNNNVGMYSINYNPASVLPVFVTATFNSNNFEPSTNIEARTEVYILIGTLEKKKEIAGTNKLTILARQSSPSPSICSKSAYWSGWSQKNTVTNGKIQERIYYIVDSNCNYQQQNTEERLLCDSGYIIEGSSSTAATYTGNEICILENTISEPIDDTPDCFIPVFETCNDNTIITIKDCVNGKLVDTNNKCQSSTITNPIEDNPIKDNPIKDDTIDFMGLIIIAVLILILLSFIIIMIKLFGNRK